MALSLWHSAQLGMTFSQSQHVVDTSSKEAEHHWWMAPSPQVAGAHAMHPSHPSLKSSLQIKHSLVAASQTPQLPPHAMQAPDVAFR
jgi:hypothetical protein